MKARGDGVNVLSIAVMAAIMSGCVDEKDQSASDSARTKRVAASSDCEEPRSDCAMLEDNDKEGIVMETMSYDGETFRRMRSKEIEKVISDTLVRVEEESVEQVVPFGERFSTSGCWHGSYQSRGPLIFEGKWKAKNDSVWIDISGHQILRREIWKSDKSNRFLLTPFFDALNGSHAPVVVSFDKLK